MPIISAGSKGLLSSGTAFTGQSASTSDNASGLGVAAASVELLNNAGNFDRQREYLSGGAALIAEPILQGLMTQMIVVLRAMLMAQMTANNLIGGTIVDYKPDTLAMSDFLTAANVGSQVNPEPLNTLQ